MPALESAHAVAHAIRAAARMDKSQAIVVGLSGRGDKDVHTVGEALGSASGTGADASVAAGARVAPEGATTGASSHAERPA
jgi:hypothetical protein